MPRAPRIPHDQLLKAILSTPGVIDSEGNIPGPANHIWSTVNCLLDGALNPRYIYQFVHENRQESYTKLVDHYNIDVPRLTDLKSPSLGDVTSETDEVVTTSSESGEQCGAKIMPEKTFIVIINPKDWEQIKPIEKKYKRFGRGTTRRYRVLPPYEWTTMITKHLWDQHKIPCPYTFERATIYNNMFIRKQYLKITARCTECGSKGTGIVLDEPVNGCAVQMQWRCNDSRNVPHSKKRQLKGKEREFVGKVHLKNASAAIYRRLKAAETMDINDVEPPHLFQTSVLRKAKQEQRDEVLKVVQGAHPITSLSIMKHSEPFAGSIHDISLDKVVIIYFTPTQLYLYKKYNKNMYIKLTLDATGSLVQKIRRLHELSGNIFLYEIVMHTGLYQLPIAQMLSEKHDANTILYWLNEWERQGAPCPKEIVIDNSPALKSALARSFGRSVDLKEYINQTFKFLVDKMGALPRCFIRIDVAHFLHKAKKWNLWENRERQRLKDFYLRCLGLLIKARTLEDFKFILIHTLSMALSPNEGVEVNGNPTPVEASLKILAIRIKGVTDYFIEKDEEIINIEQIIEDDGVEENEESLSSENRGNKDIQNWLNEIFESVKKRVEIALKGKLNPYYCPGVATELKRLSKEFVLWSAVLVDSFKSPNETASSATVESDFCDLKKRILQGTFKPLKVDRFVATHIASIEGQCRIAAAQKVEQTLDEDPISKNIMNSNQRKAKNIPYMTKLWRPWPREREENKSEDEDEPNSEDSQAKKKQAINTEQQNTDEKDNINSENNKKCVIGNTMIGDNEDNLIKDIRNNGLDGSDNDGSLKDAPCDLNYIENWRGLAKRGQRRKAKYLTPLPHFEAAVQAKRLKQPTSRLLQNGNLMGFVKLETGSEVMVKNTCSFDAVCHIFAEMYAIISGCRNFFDSSKNGLLATAKMLAVDGACKNTYRSRAETLSSVLEPERSLPLPCSKSRKKRQPVVAKEYNCYGNLTTLVKKLFENESLVNLEWTCDVPECNGNQTNSVSILEPNTNVLVSEGIVALNKAILVSLRVLEDSEQFEAVKFTENRTFLKVCGSSCGRQTSVTFTASQILLLDIEFFASKDIHNVIPNVESNSQPLALSEIPHKLQIFGESFNLTGIVVYRPGHYIAYTRRSARRWEIFDDLSCNVEECHEDELVSPNLLVFCKE